MKRCPQCNDLYEDSIDFCLNDGQPLVAEHFVLPSDENLDETPTVIRAEPIIVDLNKTNAPTEQFSYQPASAAPPVIVEKKSVSTNKILYVLLGSLIGGGLVLGAIWLAGRNVRQGTSGEKNQTVAVNAEKTPRPQSSEKPANTPFPEASAEHRTRTDTADEEFNGRVIAANAYLRDAPDRNSKQTDILPVDDRLTIMNRENENSPWFFVVCEHGKSGWIHGNTIEYTR